MWVDFENTPHVLFLEPFVAALRSRGLEVRMTAKPQAQTVDLARARGLDAEGVGGGNYAGIGAKVGGNLRRAGQLVRWVRSRGAAPLLLLHSSRTASLAAAALRVPAVGLLDYEHAVQWPLALASRVLWFPDLLRGVRLSRWTRRIARYYPGLKENLYLDERHGGASRAEVRRTLGVAAPFLVVARPAAVSAHYAVRGSQQWWQAALDALLARPDVHIVVIPRDAAQGQQLAAAYAAAPRLTVVRQATDGPALIAAADLVLGGGGTMNREAAVLGTHAWSTFCGPVPAIDDCLAREGRLTWIRSAGDLARALAEPLPPRAPRGPFPGGFSLIFADILRDLGSEGVPA